MMGKATQYSNPGCGRVGVCAHSHTHVVCVEQNMGMIVLEWKASDMSLRHQLGLTEA